MFYIWKTCPADLSMLKTWDWSRWPFTVSITQLDDHARPFLLYCICSTFFKSLQSYLHHVWMEQCHLHPACTTLSFALIKTKFCFVIKGKVWYICIYKPLPRRLMFTYDFNKQDRQINRLKWTGKKKEKKRRENGATPGNWFWSYLIQ